jgi:hypothetical protein
VTQGTAAARPITLPGSRLDLEVPYNWSATDVNVGDYGDILDYTGEGGGGAIIYSFPSCAAAFQAFSTFHGVTSSSSYGGDWLPSGWTGVAATSGDDHLVCHDLADSHSISIRDSNDAASNESWRGIVLSLLSSLSSAWYAHGQAGTDEIMTLYGSQLTTSLPSALRLTSSDRTTGKDVLTLTTTTGSAAYSVFRRTDACDKAVTAVAPALATPASTSTATGWTDYTLSGVSMVAHCYAGSVTVVVLSPTDAVLQAAGGAYETTSLLVDLGSELASAPTLGDVQTLPISQWKLAVPSGWDVTSFDPAADDYDDWWGDDDDDGGGGGVKVDMIEAFTGGSGPRITRTTDTCDQALSSGTVYDPAWMADGWRAASIGYATIRYCTTVEGGTIQVEVDTYSGQTRIQLIAILDSLRYQNTPQPVYTPDTTTYTPDPAVTPETPTPEPYTPSHHGKAILPWPLDLSLQTLKIGSDRGWGARLGLGLARPLTERISVGARGEIAYDSVSALAYDVSANLELRLTSGLTAKGYAGRDQLGSGDVETIAGAWYYGAGGAWGLYERDGGFYAEIDYDKRTGADPAMPDLMYPDHEWRFKGAIYWDGDGRIRGLSTEYRTAGDASTFLLGLKLRL